MIYNVCEHETCYNEVNAQAVSYTTGVPAMIGAKMVLSGTWYKPGTINMKKMMQNPLWTN